jgi:hypothetical protein
MTRAILEYMQLYRSFSLTCTHPSYYSKVRLEFFMTHDHRPTVYLCPNNALMPGRIIVNRDFQRQHKFRCTLDLINDCRWQLADKASRVGFGCGQRALIIKRDIEGSAWKVR